MSVFEDKRIEVSLTEIGKIAGTEFSGVANGYYDCRIRWISSW
jgi:hypothetical protein